MRKTTNKLEEEEPHIAVYVGLKDAPTEDDPDRKMAYTKVSMHFEGKEHHFLDMLLTGIDVYTQIWRDQQNVQYPEDKQDIEVA